MLPSAIGPNLQRRPRPWQSVAESDFGLRLRPSKQRGFDERVGWDHWPTRSPAPLGADQLRRSLARARSDGRVQPAHSPISAAGDRVVGHPETPDPLSRFGLLGDRGRRHREVRLGDGARLAGAASLWEGGPVAVRRVTGWVPPRLPRRDPTAAAIRRAGRRAGRWLRPSPRESPSRRVVRRWLCPRAWRWRGSGSRRRRWG